MSGDESILTEVVSASIGGAFSASVLYPLEVLKTKMQAESRQSSSANDKDEMVMADHSHSSSNDENSSSENKQNNTEKQKQKGMYGYAKHLYNTQGLVPFYTGIETSAFQSALEKALYFFAYTAFKNVYYWSSSNNKEKKMGTFMNLALGCAAEWAHLPITLPIDCLTTKIQTSDNGNKAPLAILMTMLSEPDGLKGMYKGIQAYTILCLKPAVQYTVYEQVKNILLLKKRMDSKLMKHKNSTTAVETLTSLEAFILGMIARTIATIVVFPYLRAKVMIQSSSKNKSQINGDAAASQNQQQQQQQTSIPSMVLKMYLNGGINELFQGIGPELTRGVFSSALMLMVKEKISYLVYKAIQSKG